MHTTPDALGAGGFIKPINVKDGEGVWTKKFGEPIWAGTLATAGDLMFGGTTTSRDFMALNGKTATHSGSFRTNSDIVAAPITYELDGVQYVAVVSGWGDAIPIWTAVVNQTYTKDVPQARSCGIRAM
jgi:alcohol dehydrogenase (cytochrome c)